MKSPIKDFKNKYYPEGSVTQYFGENPKLYMERMGMIGHNGIDIVAEWGTPIFAVEGGLVVDVKDTPEGYGKHLRILCDNGNEWTYGHASQNLVKVGDKVEEGQQIQLMGNTGFVVSGATPFWKFNPYAGTHLHLGLRKFIYDRKGWAYNSNTPAITILNYENGYKGSIDFKDLLSTAEPIDTPQGDIIKIQKTFIDILKLYIGILKRL
jgi:murein DD-endopeptidase MepM/ murein hydrolase activator NlpD